MYKLIQQSSVRPFWEVVTIKFSSGDSGAAAIAISVIRTRASWRSSSSPTWLTPASKRAKSYKSASSRTSGSTRAPSCAQVVPTYAETMFATKLEVLKRLRRRTRCRTRTSRRSAVFWRTTRSFGTSCKVFSSSFKPMNVCSSFQTDSALIK